MRACGFTTDESLATAIDVAGTTVQRWRHGARPEIAQLRQLVQPLRTDLLSLLVVAGWLTPGEAGGRVRALEPLTARELLSNDSALSPAARKIMLAAYDAAAEGPGLRAVARRPRKGSDS